MRRTVGSLLFFFGACAASVALDSRADEPAKPAPPASATVINPTQAVDETVLGVVPVTGSAAVPPPKLVVVPLTTTSDSDSLVQLVVRGDLDLSGQFDVLEADKSPVAGPFTHDTELDPKAWRAKGMDVLVRVKAEPGADAKADVTLTADVWALQKNLTKVAFTKSMTSAPADVRMNAHRMTDAILGAITGRPGGFASRITYAGKVGKARQVFLLDSDGMNAKSISPSADTALSPAFGPKQELYYALSTNSGPFRLVHGEKATEVPLPIKGSILGITFNPDHSKMALAVMDQGISDIYVGPADLSQFRELVAPPLANHPSFGPLNKLAYVGGSAGPRVYIENVGGAVDSGKPISPAGFHASAPSFCDSPNGLYVIFTVGVGANADLVATDTNGGSIMRLTQNQGANAYAACSPDGRLIAFFSTRTTGKGPGLYVMPFDKPWHSQRISDAQGDSLRWEAIP